MQKKKYLATSLLALAVQVSTVSFAAQEVEIKTIPVTDQIYMLQGQGGNIGVSIGQDGVFLIDDQFAPMTEKIRAAIKAISNQHVKFVINTHWHGDHTGGNENFAKTESIIVAHDNVRKRMSSKQFIELLKWEVEPSPKEALPIVTFSKDINFHLNGDTISALHHPHAHTDGDAIIRFEKANVVHMGDIYFAHRFPFIDTSSGGSVKGAIEAINQVLASINNETKIIPGHGPLSNKQELTVYRDMLLDSCERIQKLIEQGKTLEQTVAEKPLADLDEQWGQGFLNADKFVTSLYNSLTQKH